MKTSGSSTEENLDTWKTKTIQYYQKRSVRVCEHYLYMFTQHDRHNYQTLNKTRLTEGYKYYIPLSGMTPSDT